MSDSLSFVRQIKSDASQRELFKEYLANLRKVTFTRGEAGSSQAVLTACKSTGLQPSNFLRVLGRIIRVGHISPKALDRLRLAFGFRSVRAMRDDFERWSARVATTSPRQSARFEPSHGSRQFVLPRGSLLKGALGQYIIERRDPNSGSRGDSYRAKVVGSGENVFIKTLSIHGFNKIEERIARVTEFFVRERSSLMTLSDVTGVSRFRELVYADLPTPGGIRQVPCLVQDLLPGKNLIHAMTDMYGTGGKFNGVVNPAAWVAIAYQMLTVVREIHARGVRHGDIHPGNFLIHKRSLSLVDFGQAQFTPANVRGNASIHLDQAYVAPLRRQYPDMPLETYEDFYGLGQTLLWLATGTPLMLHEGANRGESNIEVRNKVEAHFKTNPRLLQYNPGLPLVISPMLHHQPQARPPHADDVVRLLEMYEMMCDRRISGKRSTTLKEEADKLREVVNDFGSHDPLFAPMIRRDLRYMLRRVSEMLANRRFEASGSRDDIIAALVSYLSILEPGDSYITATSSSYWSPENLGTNGRFLGANKMLAMRGVRIRRLFVLRKADALAGSRSESFRTIASAQAEVVKDLRSRGIIVDDRSIDGEGYFVGVIELDDDEYARLMNHGYHVGLVRKQGRTVSLSFQEDANGIIRRIFIWDFEDERIRQERLTQIDHYLRVAVPIIQVAAERA